ncbi:hypothetical protein EC841_10576 [Raoultella ornithinolytica]|uniref:Uncharacterized protein n=1 Tax=Raoultella ornithinolytica TaxID=54291 RepID=A0ABD7QGU6_RAOOR|nr:hypothetical protein EC841_10576 [Raoultella ornithinolytica]
MVPVTVRAQGGRNKRRRVSRLHAAAVPQNDHML